MHTNSAAENMNTWWDSESNLDSMFVNQKGHEWIIARYVAGKLYLNAHMH
ncbi:MAG: hypothetical protein HRT71_02960 [Flavobacteriales bacterium]|nr:hypothetical protein [Flavobacteriales bacterium]